MLRVLSSHCLTHTHTHTRCVASLCHPPALYLDVERVFGVIHTPLFLCFVFFSIVQLSDSSAILPLSFFFFHYLLGVGKRNVVSLRQSGRQRGIQRRGGKGLQLT